MARRKFTPIPSPKAQSRDSRIAYAHWHLACTAEQEFILIERDQGESPAQFAKRVDCHDMIRWLVEQTTLVCDDEVITTAHAYLNFCAALQGYGVSWVRYDDPMWQPEFAVFAFSNKRLAFAFKMRWC